jgi:hypothetical protein
VNRRDAQPVPIVEQLMSARLGGDHGQVFVVVTTCWASPITGPSPVRDTGW